MNKKRLTVIIPSRTQGKQRAFLAAAVASVKKQTIVNQFELAILVCVDAGQIPIWEFGSQFGVTFVESKGASQAAALNGAIRVVDADFVAFLEDDDQWCPDYLAYAMEAIKGADFVSSTQAEIDEDGTLIRINDYPMPSGWFMPTSTLIQVGEFNELYRCHLDNEWLGRLAEAKFRRCHMVESTAPLDSGLAQIRPWLGNVLNFSNGCCHLARHNSPYPLVRRLVHQNSGMAQISNNASLNELSKNEIDRLCKRFGRIPW